MRVLNLWVCGLAVVFLASGLAGCGSAPPTASGTPDSAPPAATDQAMHVDADHGQEAQPAQGAPAPAQSDMEMMRAGLAKLSPADRESAEKQHICPVSGKMLGTMGAPAKVAVEGRDVWICCPGCEDQLLEKPSEYLARLKP